MLRSLGLRAWPTAKREEYWAARHDLVVASTIESLLVLVGAITSALAHSAREALVPIMGPDKELHHRLDWTESPQISATYG